MKKSGLLASAMVLLGLGLAGCVSSQPEAFELDCASASENVLSLRRKQRQMELGREHRQSVTLTGLWDLKSVVNDTKYSYRVKAETLAAKLETANLYLLVLSYPAEAEEMIAFHELLHLRYEVMKLAFLLQAKSLDDDAAESQKRRDGAQIEFLSLVGRPLPEWTFPEVRFLEEKTSEFQELLLWALNNRPYFKRADNGFIARSASELLELTLPPPHLQSGVNLLGKLFQIPGKLHVNYYDDSRHFSQLTHLFAAIGIGSRLKIAMENNRRALEELRNAPQSASRKYDVVISRLLLLEVCAAPPFTFGPNRRFPVFPGRPSALLERNATEILDSLQEQKP